MADIVIRKNGCKDIAPIKNEILEWLSVGPHYDCFICGQKGTFCVVRNGTDVIASLGYTCHIEGNSLQETLLQILTSFTESQISNLKKKLVRQYV